MNVFVFGADEFGATAWVNGAQISTREFRLHGLVIANKSGTDFYAQIFNASAAFSASATLDALTGTNQLVYDLPVPASSFLPFAFGGGKLFTNGVTIRCMSAQNAAGAAITSSAAKITWEGMSGPR